MMREHVYFVTLLVSQSRSLHELSSVSSCAIIALYKLPVYKRTTLLSIWCMVRRKVIGFIVFNERYV